MRTPMLVALVLTSAAAPPFTVHAGAPDGPARGQYQPMSQQRGAGRDLAATLTEVLKLSNEQRSRFESGLHQLRQKHKKERGLHHRAMRERHQQDLRSLESLLEPNQVELYRAFLQGLELGHMPPPPHGMSQPKTAWKRGRTPVASFATDD